MLLNKNLRKIRIALYPLSLIYGLVIRVRHKLFDWGIFSSSSFDLPIICVGNITIGGTGKTPHIEYLIDLLKDSFKIAVLSRGYKRETKGFILASKQTTPAIIGDEPFQIYSKYPDVTVAVCEKRVLGIEKLLNGKLRAILLDDAFQHRHVKPGLNILLVDYNRPIFEDRLIPAGNLRDSKNQVKRTDILLITKTPEDISAIEKRLWIKQLCLLAYQKLFFTSIVYEQPKAIFSKKQSKLTLQDLKKAKTSVLIVSGIANPEPFEKKINSEGIKTVLLNFPDHHNFSINDLEKIKLKFNQIKGENKIILTTEKDAVRLKFVKEFPKQLKDKIYYLPIKINFLFEGNSDFDKSIIDYVRTNKKFGQLHS